MAVSSILLEAAPRGKYFEGVVTGTPSPGTVMELSPNSTEVGGRFQWRVFQPGTDGKRRIIAVLLESRLSGKTPSDAYANGEWGCFYCPVPGEELYMLVKDPNAGTGTTSAGVGTLLAVDSGTGVLQLAVGTEESLPFVLAENVTDLSVTPRLCKVIFTGY